MMSLDDLLFCGADWHAVKQNEEKKLTAMIDNWSNEILNTPIDDLVDLVEQEVRLDVPELGEGVVDQREKQIDLSHHRDIYWGAHEGRTATGTQCILSLPFTGDKGFFNVRPTSYTMNPPRAKMKGSTLIIHIEGTNLTAEEVKSHFDRTVGQIETHLTTLRKDVKTFNANIRATAKRLLERRKEKLLKDQDLVANLGYNLKQRDDIPRTYVAPNVKRKLKPMLPRESSEPFTPEPAISTADYNHILEVMENMSLVMEQSPAAFETIDEEGLRSHFLVQLNGHFEGEATGETFNFKGKTDILLKSNGKNIFIAECKYWKGAKVLTETVDQLLSYSSWRDTKTAIVLFNRNKDFSAVLEQINPTIEAHSNYKQTLPIEGETRFQYRFSHKDDSTRELLLSVLAFDVPNPGNS